MDPTLELRVAAKAGFARWLLAPVLQGDYKAARKTLEARLKAAPNDVEARLSLTKLLLSKSGGRVAPAPEGA